MMAMLSSLMLGNLIDANKASFSHGCSRSSVVEKVLVKAREAGKDFSVFVVDSGPLFEGVRHFILSITMCIDIHLL